MLCGFDLFFSFAGISPDGRTLTDFYSFDITKQTWEKLPSIPSKLHPKNRLIISTPTDQQIFLTASPDSLLLYLLGTAMYGEYVWVFDSTHHSWEQLDQARDQQPPATARGVCSMGSNFLLSYDAPLPSGTTQVNNNNSTLWFYDTLTQTIFPSIKPCKVYSSFFYIEKPTVQPPSRAQTSFVSLGGSGHDYDDGQDHQALLFGGRDEEGKVRKDLWHLTLVPQLN